MVKDWRRARVKVALCYPNVYRAGMTGLTVQLLYHLFNSMDGVVCERFFKHEGPPLSLESGRRLSEFDVIAVTLQYELDYVGFLEMLIRSGVPARREDRGGRGGPIVVAGGPAVWANPSVLRDYVDVFAIGEAELLVPPLIEALCEGGGREGALEALSRVEGLYVPSVSEGARRVIVSDLDSAPHPISQVVTLGPEEHVPIFGRAFNLEATRSCSRRCRFCLISWVGHPARHRGVGEVSRIVEEGVAACGVGKVAIVGAGFSDHPNIAEVCSAVVDRGLEISTPSIRGDLLDREVLELMARGGQRTLTIAPEAGNERLREVLGKPIPDDKLFKVCSEALEAGVRRLKLYFMVGLPGEEDEDVEDIVRLTAKLSSMGFSEVHVTVGPLIPKAQTPFQWLPLAPMEVLRRRYGVLSRLRRLPRVRVDMAPLRASELQALLSLGGPEMGRVVEEVARAGGRLGAWRGALRGLPIDPSFIYRGRGVDEELPWSHVQVNPTRVLVREYERAMGASSVGP